MARLTPCKTCRRQVSVEAQSCPQCGQPEPACFPGSALVLTPDGQTPLARLDAGDEVLAFNRRSGALHPRQVIRRPAHAAAQIWVAALDDGRRVEATRIHPFLTASGWVTMGNLRPGDLLVNVSAAGHRRPRKVIAVKWSGRSEPVFNLLVAGEHTFVVNGCVVHSFAYARAVRCAWHAVRELAPRASNPHGAASLLRTLHPISR